MRKTFFGVVVSASRGLIERLNRSVGAICALSLSILGCSEAPKSDLEGVEEIHAASKASSSRTNHIELRPVKGSTITLAPKLEEESRLPPIKFERFSGSFFLEDGRLTAFGHSLVLDTTSLEVAASESIAKGLHSKSGLETQEFPQMILRIREVEERWKGHYTCKGHLEIKGENMEVFFPADVKQLETGFRFDATLDVAPELHGDPKIRTLTKYFGKRALFRFDLFLETKEESGNRQGSKQQSMKRSEINLKPPRKRPDTEMLPHHHSAERNVERVNRTLKALDTNNDGRISREEGGSLGSLFQQLDRDGDGEIDMTEAGGESERWQVPIPTKKPKADSANPEQSKFSLPADQE